MPDVFISYARDEAATADQVVAALRAVGYEVWRDDEIPPHRVYAEVLAERIDAAKAVLVLWSPKAAKSQWVRSEADRARSQGKLVQAMMAPVGLPMPFDQIQCADLAGWTGEATSGPWRKLLASLAEMSGQAPPAPPATPGAPAPRPGAGSLPSIAVLPFASPGGGEAEQLLADGMVEEIVTALSRFPQLKVIGSRSSLTYRGDPRRPAEIARELGVRFFLEGAVRRAGGRLRISATLTDAADLAQVWAERFDGDADDVFELQDRVATAAAAQIAPSIDAAETRRTLGRPTEDLTAYELYLRALHLQRAFTLEALQEALAALDLALARDPNFAAALAFASLLHSLILLNAWTDDPAATAERARELARRALRANTVDPDALATIATVFIWVGDDIDASRATVGRALATNPGASMPWFASAWIELFGGRPEVAIDHFERHMALDPRSPLQVFVTGGIGVALCLMRRFDAAALRLVEALRAVPDQRPFRVALVVALAQLDRREEAAAMLPALPPRVIANALALFRDDADRALIREGLSLAGAEV